jgi:hypothetical protein
MILTIFNYAVRIIIIILGILFLSGVFSFTRANPDLVRVMGIVFILFGSYRLISYHTGRKRLSGSAGKKKYDFSPKNSDNEKTDGDDENRNS